MINKTISPFLYTLEIALQVTEAKRISNLIDD